MTIESHLIELSPNDRPHTKVVEFTFRAFASHINNKTFNPVCESKSDFGDMSWRTQVKTSCISTADTTSTNPLSQSLATVQTDKSKALAKEMKVKVGESSGNSRETKIKEYREKHIPNVSKLIKEHGTQEFTTKLTKSQCAAIITIGFGKYTSDASGVKVEELGAKVRKYLNDETLKDAPFWALVHATSSNSPKS